MKLSGRERTLLIATVLVVAVVVVVVSVVEPFVRAQLAVHQQLAERRALLARFERAAPRPEDVQRQVDGLRARLRQAEAPLFRGDKPALAAAELQGLLNRITKEVGVTTMRENVPPPRTKGAFTEVAVELSLRGDLRTMRNFFVRVQAAPRLVTVSKLVLRSHPAPGVLTLTADVQLTGYLLGNGEHN
jgi:Tfp pilus assembly protein PilO